MWNDNWRDFVDLNISDDDSRLVRLEGSSAEKISSFQKWITEHSKHGPLSTRFALLDDKNRLEKVEECSCGSLLLLTEEIVGSFPRNFD